MATEILPAAAAIDSSKAATIAHLEFRQTELKAKAVRLANVKSVPAHDANEARDRVNAQLAEIASELQKLNS